MALIEINKNSQKALEKLREDIYKRDDTIEFFQERITELELALEDQDWKKITGDMEGKEFSTSMRRKVNRLARLFWLKNPLIKRAVYTQTSYVFGQGVSFEAEHELVNEVIQDFTDDLKNRAELTGHQSLMTKETELQLFGNIFFVFFVAPDTGRVRVRTIPVNEIEDIIANPDDSKEPWYYKRRYIRTVIDKKTGKQQTKEEVVFYPDWNLENPRDSIDRIPVETSTPVYHVKVNCLSDMKFGISETYAAHDWAKAYKGFLEDWATIAKSLTKFTWRVKAKGGKTTVQSAKDKLNSTLKSDEYENNPAPPAGSTFVSGQNTDLEPIKLQGVNMRAEDGDKMIHMVCAATGIFYHYLVGDPSTGNLATAKAMERPMELMFIDRQSLWKSALTDIFNFVIEKSIEAPKGKLRTIARMMKNEWDEWVPVFKKDTDNPDPEKRGEPISSVVNIQMPELLEKDVEKTISSIVQAATLGGRQAQGFIEEKEISRLLLLALGVENVDKRLEQMYPDGDDSKNDSEPDMQFRNAVKGMRDSLQKFVEHYNTKENGRE